MKTWSTFSLEVQRELGKGDRQTKPQNWPWPKETFSQHVDRQLPDIWVRCKDLCFAFQLQGVKEVSDVVTHGEDVRQTDTLFIVFNCYKHSAAQDGPMLIQRSGLPVIDLLQLLLDVKSQVDVNFIFNINMVFLKRWVDPVGLVG